MQIKICGLTTPDALTAAIESGADFVGFVFHPASPRHLDLETARYLRSYVPTHVGVVALLVDPTNAQIDEITSLLRPDMLQLHGSETPSRVAEIKERSKTTIMKALPVTQAADLDVVKNYEPVCDWLLFDSGPGGSGRPFDWVLLKDKNFLRPWMLAGGLHEGNIAAALSVLKPGALDVSSGVESAPGRKDPAKIRAFIGAARAFPK